MNFLQQIIEIYAQLGNAHRAVEMRAYMRNQFDFYGIPKPQRAAVNAPLFKEFETLTYNQKDKLVRKLWKLPQRELHYFAMEAISRKPALWEPQADQLFDHMILKNSWWDTVDFIAAKNCGAYLAKYPEERKRKVQEWTSSGSFWMHRTALLFQLKYKENTDEALLFSLCKRYSGESEFFMRKAIGWVLREYSKTNPRAVRQFIAKTPLSPLSIKEGSKYI